MSLSVFLALIFASFFQASWNFSTKKSKADKIMLLSMGWLIFGLLLLPISVVYVDWSLITWKLWVYTALACVVHAFYVNLLGWGYSLSDLSSLYPIARGCGVAFTSLAYVFLLNQSLPAQGFLGIAGIVLGTFLIGLSGFGGVRSLGFALAILVAMNIATYSLVDAYLVGKTGMLFYLTISSLGSSFLSLVFNFKKISKVKVLLQHHKKELAIVAFAGNVSYVVMLWAFTQSKAPYVVALREFSVVVASFLAYYFLKEKFNRPKYLGLIFIVLGLITLKLA